MSSETGGISLNKFPDYLVMNINVEGKDISLIIEHDLAKQARDKFVNFYPYEEDSIHVARVIPFSDNSND